MPGPLQFECRALRQAFDLQDQRRRTVRIFVAAEREAIERGQVLRASPIRAKLQIEESAMTGAPV